MFHSLKWPKEGTDSKTATQKQLKRHQNLIIESLPCGLQCEYAWECLVIDAGVPLPSTADPGSYPVIDYRSGDFTRCLMMSTRAAMSQEQIFALFDIIPGMEYCELQRDAYGMSKG